MNRSRGGYSSKLHAASDALGNPVKLILTGGANHDITQSQQLIEGFIFEALIADKGYDKKAFANECEAMGAEVVIPSRKNAKEPRTYDKELYKERNVIERFFSLLKQFRRVATRYEKLDQNYLAMAYFASCMVLLR